MKRGGLIDNFDNTTGNIVSGAIQVAGEAAIVNSVVTQLKTNPFVLPVLAFHGIRAIVNSVDEELSSRNMTLGEGVGAVCNDVTEKATSVFDEIGEGFSNIALHINDEFEKAKETVNDTSFAVRYQFEQIIYAPSIQNNLSQDDKQQNNLLIEYYLHDEIASKKGLLSGDEAGDDFYDVG
jgi:hypothetical protein